MAAPSCLLLIAVIVCTLPEPVLCGKVQELRLEEGGMDKESGQRRLVLGQAGVGTQRGAAHSNSGSSLLWGKKRNSASLNIDRALEKGLSLLSSSPPSTW